jgi:hypothetical protein
MNNIYLLNLKEIGEMEDTSNSDFSHPIFDDLAMILSEYTKYIGFSDDGYMFVRLPEHKLSELEYIINKYTTFTKEDVTSRVISGEMQRMYPEVEKLTPMLFRNFRLELTTVDNILDRIRHSGLSSLDMIDMSILEQ